ncbi:hypothetical protein GGD57_002552 [Rhizobium esperanzae]|uniref:Uncharacterized protein n=1 Tax=Rhizobium esperanzae TaxID=1967781 RepID=A0A7W6W4W2_9HYPH|nr:hypothetical protein [Rhizobium esperanzae]
MSFDAFDVPTGHILCDWPPMNFKASTNPAKNGTVPRNYLDMTAVRTEPFLTHVIGQI